ncbi:MAG: deoxyribodipyrimidine photo-lyase [Pseudomonadales bacterium]|nr:deoxyribodipyrimidine photo-lyase [Pseudomonadales bacterium]
MLNAIWFRNDLRLYDNPALCAAGQSSHPIVAFYFFTPEQFRLHDVGETKQRFILETLAELQKDLAALNIPLIAMLSSDYSNSENLLGKLCDRYNVQTVFANRELELNERIRDRAAVQRLEKAGKSIQFYQDQTILPVGEVLTAEGTPYRVFTPFKRAWLKQAAATTLASAPPPKRQTALDIEPTSVEEILSWQSPTHANRFWQAGSHEAFKRLDNFCNSVIDRYQRERDLPSLESTSQLSPYLGVGAISLRTCLLQALQYNHHEWDSGNQGILTWINELIWREFYKNLSYHYPELSKGEAFNSATKHIPWSRDTEILQRWQKGMTGFPLVDAGMRQLNHLGWMHNRLRMVTAMFLTKQLFIDWHLGEAYFMQNLIDADYAANNGGWQWSASTGADAAPYFRVFNPVRQSQRFDANGDFIRKWVPELAGLGPRQIHDPSPIERQIAGYPLPIVDHKSSVEYVKQAFKTAQAMESV